MAVWRMAMKAGSQGQDMWPLCRELGVAAITYRGIDAADLSHYFSREELYVCLEGFPSSPKANMRKILLEMKPGDTIYVKDGAWIASRGTVTGTYRFDPSRRIVDRDGLAWSHQVPVAWETGFQPIQILLGSELTTILELNADRLQRLKSATHGK